MRRPCVMVVATLLLSAPLLRADDAKVVPTARTAAVLPEPTSLSILPAAFTIQGADNKQQMLVTGSRSGRRRGAVFRLQPPSRLYIL